MARNVIDKLLGRNPALPAEVSQAQAGLAELGRAQPALADLAGQLGDFLPALYGEPVAAAAPSLPREKAAEKLNAGVPLLRGEALDIDWPALTRRLQGMIGTLKQRRADAAGSLARALGSKQLDVAAFTEAVLAGRPQAVHERADALGLDAPLTASVLSLALYPVFGSLRAELQPVLTAGPWEQGYCPVCGSFPKLGEFRGLEQIRFLRCSLCAAEWQFPRLRCPGCGNQDHRKLGYLHVVGEEGKCRAATCDNCRQYVKMVSTLTALGPVALLVSDVATVHLDLLAAEKGFGPLE